MTSNLFLKYIETKCVSEMKKCVKFEVEKKSEVALQRINDQF